MATLLLATCCIACCLPPATWRADAQPVSFAVRPQQSNWTWVSHDNGGSSSGGVGGGGGTSVGGEGEGGGRYVWVTVLPAVFAVEGNVTVDVASCSPDRFNSNVSSARITDSQLLQRRDRNRVAPQLRISSNGLGDVAASDPIFNISTAAAPPFDVEQVNGDFSSYWTAPTAVWSRVTGTVQSGDGFPGGPLDVRNLTVPLAAFGDMGGSLKLAGDRGESLRLFVNSTMVIDARQLLLYLNASASLLSRVLQPNADDARVAVRLVLFADGDNPCALVRPPSPSPSP